MTAGVHTIDPKWSAPDGPIEADDELARRVVAAVLGGDRDAFRILIDRESSSVVRTCHRILGNLPDAEDAAQEAFVTAYRALETWRSEGSFGAWLGRIAIRVAQRHARRRGTIRELTWVDPPAVGSFEGRGTGSAGPVASLSPVATARAGQDDPASMLLRSESAARIRAALARLEEPYREVLALRFFAELSLAEIATQSGRPVATVKTHLRRGLLRLRDNLGDER
jgi:RNA polymerase sigma-70 factor (ECF subfamily)